MIKGSLHHYRILSVWTWFRGPKPAVSGPALLRRTRPLLAPMISLRWFRARFLRRAPRECTPSVKTPVIQSWRWRILPRRTCPICESAGSMRIPCPTCGKSISAADIHIDGALATCRACNSVTSVNPPGLHLVPTAVRSAATSPPSDLSVQDDGSSLLITIRSIWRRRFLETALVCVGWNSAVAVCYWLVLTSGDPYRWLPLIILIPHTGFGLLFVYLSLARFLNRTVIEVTPEFLTVRHGPVPWPGDLTLPVDELKRFYCYNKGSRATSGCIQFNCVGAMTKGGSIVDLVIRLPDIAQALVIKQALECWLKIGQENRAQLYSASKKR
jgi:hypothetical protein